MKRLLFVLLAALLFLRPAPARASALSSPNIPLDSPIYLYLEKLSAFGLVTGDFKGIRPFSRSEAARLLAEAQQKIVSGSYPPFASELVQRLKELLPREVSLRPDPGAAPPFDFNPLSNARLRYVYLHGAPRSYERPVHDAGGDWIFPLPQHRRDFPEFRVFQMHGTEGTPLLENNEGISYGSGSSMEGRFSSEAYLSNWGSALVEPVLVASRDDTELRLNKGYLKLGGGGLELEAGRDSNWLGLGYRGNIILTNNAENLTGVKISSPEPVDLRWFWDFKYAVLFSQLDKTVTYGNERHPYFYAIKLSMKPTTNIEWGVNLGRQVGGPGTGLNNSMSSTLRGLVGAVSDDNSNTLAGAELRVRLPWLWNTELYGEFNGEDRSDYWTQATSYVAGILVPRLGWEGRDDLRFEYFLGHEILYTNGLFPRGYLYENYPLGHSQGGSTTDYLLRYTHWFSVRNTLALEGIYTTRGDYGRIPVNAEGAYDPNGTMQALEKKFALRAFWRLPVYGEWDATLMYGWERVDNKNLVEGASATNQLLRLDVTYRY
ncbi:capsule assembly Wzi family protein [Geomonas sp. RF6]|uniref:capsule assembly Wzi family protein n=1 Tax=Geomonas sp. RF6 TaxID=2897342 RepID=UPI001E411CE8|nr:capsule assembly Wzi family protein [Geomonas sp. RF6]UFS71298.1 capsule assembly Wzi family protein [Geomonas sp. RF6]